MHYKNERVRWHKLKNQRGYIGTFRGRFVKVTKTPKYCYDSPWDIRLYDKNGKFFLAYDNYTEKGSHPMNLKQTKKRAEIIIKNMVFYNVNSWEDFRNLNDKEIYIESREA